MRKVTRRLFEIKCLAKLKWVGCQ